MARVYANVKSALLPLFSMFLFKIIYPIYCKNLNQNLDTLFLMIASSFSQKNHQSPPPPMTHFPPSPGSFPMFGASVCVCRPGEEGINTRLLRHSPVSSTVHTNPSPCLPRSQEKLPRSPARPPRPSPRVTRRRRRERGRSPMLSTSTRC